MILATIRMNIPPTKRNEALGILSSVAEQCTVYAGCLGCHIYNDVQEENVLMFEERWRTEDELAQHLRSEKYHDLLLVIEMALTQPEVRFNAVSSFTGIETIEKARFSGRIA